MPHRVCKPGRANFKTIMTKNVKKIDQERKKKGQERDKDLIYKEIKRLHEYHSGLMECYMNTVRPYGLGYDMPEAVREHATKLAEQAARVREKNVCVGKASGYNCTAKDSGAERSRGHKGNCISFIEKDR